MISQPSTLFSPLGDSANRELCAHPLLCSVLGALIMSVIGCASPFSIQQVNDEESFEPLTMLEIDSAPLSISGRLSISVTPPASIRYSEGTIRDIAQTFPAETSLELPRLTSSSGALLVADDLVSDPIAIEATVWAIDPEMRPLLTPRRDEDPFSKFQFLLSLPPWRRSAEGVRAPILYDIYATPKDLPPRWIRNREATSRIDLTLPPLSEVVELRGAVYQSGYLGRALERAQVIAYGAGSRVSTQEVSDERGQFVLSLWSDAVTPPLTLIASPPIGSLLPKVLSTIPPLSDSAVELSAPIIYPILEPTRDLSMIVEYQTEPTEGMWTAHWFQGWSEEEIKGDRRVSPEGPQTDGVEEGEGEVDRIGEERRDRALTRASGLWRQSQAFREGEVSSIHVYLRPGVLFVQPPTTHPSRTTRVELATINAQTTLRVLPQLKVSLRGQIRGEGGEGVPSTLYAKQLSWPWPSAHALSRGEYWSRTEDEGGFILQLDPGEYALRVTPLDVMRYAPKVLMVTIPEDEGVILPATLTTLERGVWRRLIVDPVSADPLKDSADSDRGDAQSALQGASVHLYCELSPSRLAPLASSAGDASSSAPTLDEVYRVYQRFSSITRQPIDTLILLSESALTTRGVGWFKVGSGSCPSIEGGSSLYP